MDNRKYCKVLNGKILEYNKTRKAFKVGSKSKEDVCIAKGYYLIIDNKPLDIATNQRISSITYKVNEEKKQVIKSYNIENIPVTELIVKARYEMEKAINTLISSEIKKYNKKNGLLFKDIDALNKYLVNPNYTHYTFINSCLLWNVDVWEKARAIEKDVILGNREIPTVKQLLTELPKFKDY